MYFYKTYPNGLKLVINKIDGLMSVSTGVLVKTGSINETDAENGISHFIEHTVFKGTKKRSAFGISDFVDGIGAQINAFTSKEITCYYTKSTADHTEDSLEVLSDIFFNSVFQEEELEKEKGVVIEEINMTEDSPEDTVMDLIAEAYYGKEGLGKTILGPSKNIKSFTRNDIISYMDKYYCADNVVISVAGNVDIENVEKLVNRYFANNFTRFKSNPQFIEKETYTERKIKVKPIEQAHLALSMPAYSILDERSDAFGLINFVFGGGMSSRLFQTIREKLGLCYSVYSYPSQHKNSGVVEIYAGVNVKSRDSALNAIIEEIELFKKGGMTEKEFLRCKEQFKSSIIMSQESTASQMLLFGKNLLLANREVDFEKRIKAIENLTLPEINSLIKESFNTSKMAIATLGPDSSPLKI